MIGKCPPPQALDAIAGGDDPSGAFAAHAELCPACRAKILEIRSTHGGLRDAARADASRGPLLAGLPAVVPGFELLEEISRGGQGVVYRAVQTATKRPAAVKMLLWGAFSTVRQRNRFEREIEIAARLRHPNIVTIFESGVSTDGRRYVAMEYVEGRPLDRFVQAELANLAPRARTDRVIELIAQVASAVGHAHASGVIHRDIKPSNILVDSAGVPRVLDFGLAHELESLSDISLTQEFVGTPAYAAPEQFAGDPGAIDARSDVYSLGVVLYAMLTGAPPYPSSGSLAATIEHIRSTAPAPPSRHVPRLPADLDVILLQALAKDPSRRYATALALAADLEDFRAGRPISARRDSTFYVLRKLAARHHVPVAAGGITLLVVIAAVIVLAILSRSLDQQRRIAEAALAESNLQRGRLLVRTGGTLQAEQLLWHEAQQANVVANDQLGFEDAASARRASWALLELYSQLPRMMVAPADAAPARVGFRLSDQSIWSVSARGVLERWSLDGSRATREFQLPADSPTGRWIVSRDGCRAFFFDPPGVRLFDLDAGGAAVPLDVPESLRLAAAEDGKTIVSFGSGAGAQVIDVDTHATLATIEGDFTAADFQGPFLALASAENDEGQLRLYSRRDWRLSAALSFHGFSFERRFQGLCAVSPDERFAVVLAEGTLFLFSLPEGGGPRATRFVQSPFSSQPQFSSDGRSVLTITQDGTMTLWRVPELTPARIIRNPASVSTSEFHEPWVVTGHLDGSIASWHVADDPWPTRLPGSATTTHGLALHPNGELLATGDEFGRLTLLRIGRPDPIISRVQAHANRITSIDFAPAGDRLVTAGKDGALRLWDCEGRPLAELPTSGGEFWCVRFSPDGRWIAASRADGGVFLWNADGRSKPRMLDSHVERVPAVAFSPDGHFLASVSVMGTVVVWDLGSATVARSFGVQVRHTRIVAFSPDGQTVAVGADDRTIRIWDARTGSLLRTINDLPWGPFDLQYHPSGRVLFVVGRGSEIVVVDTEACREIANFPAHERLIFKLRLDRAGRRLFTAGEDDWIGVWDLDHLRRCVRGNSRIHGASIAADR